MHSVLTSRRVAYALQALEGSAVEAWYPRKQQLELDGKEPYNWDTVRAKMTSKYADVSPDMVVCSKLAVLKQGNGSVQAYHEKVCAIIPQADNHPVRVAEVAWHFKQGLSDRIRTAIAIYGDDDLDTVVMQAKRVDAYFPFVNYTISNPHIRCVAADSLWQPSSLPSLGISSTMYLKALQTARLFSDIVHPLLLTPASHSRAIHMSKQYCLWQPLIRHSSQVAQPPQYLAADNI